jgi:hypothetical protein
VGKTPTASFSYIVPKNMVWIFTMVGQRQNQEENKRGNKTG